MLTVFGLCSGFSAVHFAVQDRYETALVCLLLAVILDALDGRLARLLRVTSEFGAQLDSLADIVNFGVAPALVLYSWSVNQLGNLGWVLVLLFVVCCALRLARFNAGLNAPEPTPLSSAFFTGVPAPAGGGVVILPMLLSFTMGPGWFDQPILVGMHMLVMALMMASRIPTYSVKRFRLMQDHVVPALLAVALLAALLVTFTWWTLTVLIIAYLASIPFSCLAYRRAKRALALGPQSPAESESDRVDPS
jgi:CDP-diacylglycerol--serine O-phosphatidyltransferase